MDQLQVQVARARRRLVIEQFLGRSIWCLLAALSLAAIAIALPRLMVISNLPTNWDTLCFIGALVGGIIAAMTWTIVALTSELEAAIEIDRRFELRERVASSLSLSTGDRESEAGRALVGDAARAISRIEVDEKFRVNLDRRAWLPLLPGALVLALVFLPTRSAESSIDPNSPAARKQTKANMTSLREKMVEQQKKAKPGELPAAEDMFKKIDEGMKELTDNKTDPDRSKATVKLNDLAKQLDDKKQQLGAKDELKKQLEGMKNFGNGPADKAAQAMKDGNWEQAKAEIEKLQKQIAEGKLNEEDKKALANQLQKMQEKLEAAADARNQAMDGLKKQIEEAKKEGNLAKAGELQQKLDKMAQQQQQMNKLQQLAQQMAIAQQAMKQGDNQKAADAMQQIAQQMQQMQQDQKEMQAMNEMMKQLQMAKDAMACEQCNGAGCEACQGGGKQGDQLGQLGDNPNNMGDISDNPPGMGMGPGRGQGPRPIAKDDTNTRDTRIRPKVGRGEATFGGLVEGPNIKGEVAEQIKQEMATLNSQSADPLTNERLPASRREQAEEYFRTLREGK